MKNKVFLAFICGSLLSHPALTAQDAQPISERIFSANDVTAQIDPVKQFTAPLTGSTLQAAMVPGSAWQVNPNEQKVFIENKGQYNGKNKLIDAAILYGVEDRGMQIYFSNKGLTYRTDKTEIKGKIEEEVFEFGKEMRKDEYRRELREIEERKKKTKHISSVVNLTWVNANPDVRILVEEEVPQYFNYMAGENPMQNSIYHAKGYKKLVYRDLYPGIDVEYIFHATEGIKYSLILHPGADISQVRMKYSGNEALFKDGDGNIHVSSLAGDIVDHAPSTFYASDNSMINSSFEIKNNTVGFVLENYDGSRDVIIDPWTVAPAFGGGDNKVLDVQHDAAGNIYVYGSQNPYKVRKYTSAGVAVWTFNTANSDGAGDIATDPSGNTYCTKGGNSACFVIKLDPAGTLLFSNTTTSNEMWRLAFNYNYTTLLVAGAFMNGSIGNLAYVDMNNGALMNMQDIGGDLRSLCANPNGNFHALVATVTAVTGISPALSQIWGTNTSYAANYNPGPNYTNSYPTWPVSGQNALAGFCGNLFLYNGATIYKYNANTGASVGLPTAVAGGVLENNSGIAIDGCGNVYVGTQTSVIKYNPSLTQTGSAATSGAVYDITINSNGDVIACGNNFVAALNIAGCVPLAVAATSTAACGGNTGSVSASPTGGTPAYTYSWSPGGQTSQTVNNLPAGTYTVVVMDASNCLSATTTVTIASNPLAVTASTSSVTVCAGQSVTLTGGGATTYTWSANAGSATTSTVSVTPPAGTTIYTVTGTTGACSNTATVSVTANTLPTVTAVASSPTLCAGQSTTLTGGGATNYTWSANAGGVTTNTASVSPPNGTTTYTVTGNSGGCANTATVSVTVNTLPAVTASAASPSVCPGQSTTLTGGGATNYTWSANAGSATTATVSVSPGAGTVTYTVTGATNGCSNTNTVSVTVNPLPNASASTSGTISCGGGTANVIGSSTTPGVTYSWSGPGIVSGGSTSNATVNLQGVYTVTVTDPSTGCSNTATTSVTTSTAVPNATASTTGSLTCTNNVVTINGNSTTSGVTIQWSGPSGFSSSAASATVSVAGTYTFTVTDPGSGCTNTALTTVTTNTAAPNASASASGTITCAAATATLNASSSTGGVTYSWNGPSGFSSSSQSATASASGIYTVTVTDPSNGCISTATTSIATNTTQPNASATSSGTIGCAGGTATVNANSTTPGVTYNWSGAGITAGGNTSSATVNATGVYTVTVTDPANGCTNTAATTVSSSTAVPNASATTSGTITCLVTTVTLNGNSSTSGVTYSWSGPGGFTSSTQTPTVSVNGTYTLTVTDPGNGCTNTVTATVTSNTTQPNVSASTSGTITCSGGTATVTANSTTPGVTYNWSGPGIVSGGSTASANVNMQGNYTVTVTDPSNGCTNTASTNVTISAGVPNASASTTGTLTCVNNSAVINGNSTTSGATYSWSGPGGFTSSAASATVTTNGTYTLTVTDPGNGCTNSVVTSVTTDTAAPNASSSTTGSITCSSNTASVNASSTASGATFSWSGPGVVAGGNTSAATVNASGLYTVTVTDPANGCSNTSVTSVTTDTAQPSVSASTTGTISCGGGTASVSASSSTGGVNYSWSGSGIVSGGSTSSATVNAAGTYTVTVTDPANGCVNTATTVVTLDAAVPNASASATGMITCVSNTVSISGNSTTSGVTYSWAGPGGFSTASQNAIVGQAGTYTLTVTDPSNNCSNVTTVTVTANTTQPNASAAAAGIITCSTLTASISGNSTTSGATYSWSGPGAFSSSNQNNTVSAAGIYTVTVTDPANGCTSTDTALVSSNTGSPVISAGIDVSIPAGGSTTLNANGGTSYTWTPAAGLSCTTCGSPIATPSVTTIYCVQAQGANGCIGNDCVEVSIEAECGEVFVPTGFSPNGDGHNDIEYVMGNCLASIEFTIYDRWGEKVFESTNPKHGWDGIFRGEKLNTAVFAYYLRAVLTSGKEVIKKGNIHLIR